MRTAMLRRLLPLALLGLSPRLAATQAPDTTLKREVLADGIHLFRAPSDLDRWTATNVVVIVNDDDVTVFDSNTRPRTARLVIAEIRKLTPKPVRTLINSHWHMDHWSGNDEYVKAWPGLRIVATTETRDYMKRMTPRFFTGPLETQAARRKAALDSAIASGRKADGTPLTAEARRKEEEEIASTRAFAAEVATIPRVLPNMAYRDSLVFWSGRREFRLISVTGDATGSTVLYLPAEKMLVMGDVLVAQEDGDGGPPWTTNSYAITPWRNSLRALAALDATVVVPGQGRAFRDKAYLERTAELLGAIIDQVHAALERGVVPLAELQAAVNVDAIGRRYMTDGRAPGPEFAAMVGALVRKVQQESLDGVSRQ
jgi:cyclase